MCTGVSFRNTPLSVIVDFFSIFPQGYTIQIIPKDGTVSLTVTISGWGSTSDILFGKF